MTPLAQGPLRAPAPLTRLGDVCRAPPGPRQRRRRRALRPQPVPLAGARVALQRPVHVNPTATIVRCCHGKSAKVLSEGTIFDKAYEATAIISGHGTSPLHFSNFENKQLCQLRHFSYFPNASVVGSEI